MSGSLKSLSQIWGKTQASDSEPTNNLTAPSTSSRRQLSRQFNSVTDNTSRMLRSRNVLSSINLNVSNVPKETRKLIQAGADKVSSTLNGVRSTLDHWSQVNIYI